MNFKDIAATLRKSGYSPKKADAKIAHDINSGGTVPLLRR